jgi:ATP-dependent protease ClpP protease subunit
MPVNKSWFTMKAEGKRAKINIHEEIGAWGKNYGDFAKELNALGEDITDIDISINSPGGEVFDGFAIYDTLTKHKANKDVRIEGVAASVSSIIAMAGNKITMPRNAFMMIHNPSLFTVGDAKGLRSAADLLDKVKKNAVDVYKKKAKNISDKELSDMMDDETWMTAEEAVTKGFADIVEDAIPEPEEEVRIENKFSKVPVACMCFFKTAKNTGNELSASTGGTATGNSDGTGTAGTTIIINQRNTNQQNSITNQGAKKMPMTTKEIVSKTISGKNKIDQEAKNILAMASGKIPEDKMPELVAIVSAGASVPIDCDDPENIEASADGILAAMKNKSSDFILGVLQPVPPAKVTLGTEDQEKFCGVARTVLLNKAGITVEKKDIEDARSNGFGDMGLQSMCREILARNGVRNAMHMPADSVYNQLCGIRAPRMGNAQGSGDFANVFLDVANKVMAKAWESVPTTYQVWTSSDTIPDFRTKNIIRLSEMGDVKEMLEGEGFPYTSMKDSKETASLKTYGVTWGISRKAIINDDLNALTNVPEKLARSMRRKINRLVYVTTYGTSMAGPTMAETNAALLSSTNKNFVADTSGAAPSTVTLATLRQKMMKQTLPEPDGGQSDVQYTNIPPKFILYHSNLDVTVNQLLRATYDTDTTASLKPNMPFIQGLVPIWDPVLDELMDAATDPHVGWYLIAAPEDIATCCVYSLTGSTMPTIRTRASDVGEPLGTAWDIYHDVGIGFPDYRGIAGNYGE